MQWVRFCRSVLWMMPLLIAACGGGGGGASLAGLPASPAAATGAGAEGSGSADTGNSAAAAASGAGGSNGSSGSTEPGSAGGAGGKADGSAVWLSGTASFDSVPNDSGSLNYAALVSKPVRGACVEIVDARGNVVATAATDAQGAYRASVPAGITVLVRVKAQMEQDGGGAGPAWDVTVRDNTQSDAVYAMETGSFASGTGADLTRDVHAPSGWDGSSYSGARVAAPFALLDTVYAAQAKVLSVAPASVFPSLRVFWSSNNLPAGGNPALGQIGTTSFTELGDGRAIYVLGKADVDTDEYDSPVIAHEWGHYYQSVFSRDDSPGGGHSPMQSLDRRLAFSEGWGNAWSGIALGRSTYTDSVGPGQSQGMSIDLSAIGVVDPGWFSEASIQAVFWHLNDQLGFAPIHATMTGDFKSGVPVSSIHPFAAAFRNVDPADAAALNGLLLAEKISAAPDDPWGISETNDGGITGSAGTLPMYRDAAVGVPATACVSNRFGGGNKLGSYVYLRFNAPTARLYGIRVDGPAGTDPDFAVFQGRKLGNFDSAVPASESASLNLAAGDAVLAITDYNNTSAATCFSVSIQ